MRFGSTWIATGTVLVARLGVVALLLATSACALKVAADKGEPKPLTRQEECLAELEDLKGRLVARESVETTRMDLAALFAAVSPDCDTRNALFRAALRKGRKNGVFLTALGYAVYAGDLLRPSDEKQGWQVEVWKDEIRKTMLDRVARLRRLARRGRVPQGLYEGSVRQMLAFAVWNLDTDWRRRRPSDFPGMEPSEIPVEDLAYLTHSIETLRVYFSRYAGDGLLGNLRNFETMRDHLDRLLAEEDDVCGFAASLADSGISALELEAPYAIQTGEDAYTGAEGARTSSPSFIRREDSTEAAKNLLIEVPATRESPYRVWPGGVTYLLRPEPASGPQERVLRAKVDWKEKVSPRIRVLRLLGKLKPGKPDVLTVGLDNPRIYRMVTYIDTGTFRRMRRECGITLSSVQAPR